MRKSIKAARTARNVAAATEAPAEIINVPAVIDAAATTETTVSETSATEAHESGALVIDGATGETVQPEAGNTEAETETATEAQPDERVVKAERVAADRAAIKALYSAFDANRLSVPVKTLAAFKLAPSTCHPIARNPSARQAAAIALAFAGNGKKLRDGATVNRVFEIDGKSTAIENGAMRDAISSGLITVSGDSPEAERLTLSKRATKAIIALIGETTLRRADLLPEAKQA
jgi:hypothetical protein